MPKGKPFTGRPAGMVGRMVVLRTVNVFAGAILHPMKFVHFPGIHATVFPGPFFISLDSALLAN
jgi:hypothetical protein